MFEYNAKLLSIVDGDTMHLEVDLGFHVLVHETFRLARVNAPELMSFDGIKAKAFVVGKLSAATAFKVQTKRAEKYGRWLCELLYQVPGEKDVWHNLNTELLESRNAVPYRP